ncbi:MAG: phosphoribosylformylglycinamidine synthase [Phascolarctobacterium sp.]|uniref:phosphoribosylformylglycinamidine synthase n=1 Tax=Phascolarctobacterium sp. TaxID=2049039 RepID=UPI0026DB2B5D|nr:phosphoribosylformylglycinamidine synthase [Phascolarctobacterium sp.]MDO4921094.1 phosphoribosylformylglycinamidine synthase [Phascolarctobacterium sp.]
MSNIRRIFVEKKDAFAVEAHGLLADLRNNLGMSGLQNIRIVNRYDVMGLSDEEFAMAKALVLSEPPVDTVMEEELPLAEGEQAFAVELLPGQYDQREDFAEQCIQLITQKERPTVAAAKVYILQGQLDADAVAKIKAYCINPIEAREAEQVKPETLISACEEPARVKSVAGFLTMTREEAEGLRKEMGLAMSLEDLLWCQKYFNEERREPTITEIRVLDTYWSDHCRHTTFMTQIEDVEIIPGTYTKPVQEAYDKYMAARDEVYGENTERPVTLMDIAVIGMKKLRKEGKLDDLDQSEEINACSIVVPIEVDGKQEDWLVMFKNETHNHPTEIEPFGGAATCLGGAIRDPLSGRSYVYQAMRVTGCSDPRTPVSETLPGKLPQRKITIGAAAGYSSYGNQIGLATGHVQEYYHEKFVAKRMEIGGVMGAAPRSAVRRERPAAGDIVVLLGGKTGRDGCGGATGSSKEHTVDSLMSCGAEVQKGNPPTERKIQRLFRNSAVTAMIKRCNDFGAGGVSVAIGELTDGLVIDLDKVPKKYEGLDGTELAISESQERMAVVIEAANRDAFIKYADEENLEATVVAEVTADPRLVMYWRGDKIVDLSRAFLDTNGVAQHTNVVVSEERQDNVFEHVPEEAQKAKDLEAAWLNNLGRLNVCSQKGLSERFDSTIGRGTVLMPFGGKTQLTPSEGMVGRIPVLHGNTCAATVMACGYNPAVACWSPFHSAMYAVTESVVRAVALGADPAKLRLTLQEYFPKLHDANSWGQPFSALLGAFTTLDALDLPAIGGKDSMSGTFMDKTVPPTLVSFAVGVIDGNKAVSAEFKAAGHKVVFLSCPRDNAEVLDFAALRKNLAAVHTAMENGRIAAAAAVKEGGIAALVTTMAMGNELGFEFIKPFHDTDSLFTLQPGGMVLELADDAEPEELFDGLDYMLLGHTTERAGIAINDTVIAADRALAAYRAPLQTIFPDRLPEAEEPADIDMPLYKAELSLTAPVNIAKPRVFIPVFPGNNCEYDSARAFEAAGAVADTFIVRNLTAAAIEESVEAMVKYIENAQIVMIPGGFSAGDEPDGSGKFIATMFRNPRIKEAISDLLENRDGLMLGICNGFQALIKLGLVPYGEVRDLSAASPTLTFNNIGRHVSQIVTTRVVSNKSPWLSCCEPGEEHAIAVSHGEGRFYAPESVIKELFANGQVATQYVNMQGVPTMNTPYNPNGSLYAIEGITSPDGRILGKMGHSERFAPGLFRNICGEKDQKLFKSGVNYFK